MASLANDPGGRRRIIFLDKDRNRKTIYLGKIAKNLANEIKAKVEAIITAAIAARSVDGDTAEWLGKVGDELHAKLASAGLTTPRKALAAVKPLGEFIAEYIDKRADIAPNTRRNMLDSYARLVEFFGASKMLRDITEADADHFLAWLKNKYADGTAGRTVKRAKQFLRSAVRAKTIASNPFEDIVPPSQVNDSRKFFVTIETAYQVLEACPDTEWRLIFALSRFAGLRCPSEHLVLTWDDVDWEKSRFRVDSPKTGIRWVPIFPELKPYLEDAYDAAPDGAVHIIRRYRDANQNLRTQLLRILRRAGVKRWPKLFHNLRATRETELMASHPVHVVCEWIGNDAAIAQKHYLQVLDSDFERAVNSAPNSAQQRKTARQTAQHAPCTDHAKDEQTQVFPGFSSVSSDFSEVEEYPRQDSNLRPAV